MDEPQKNLEELIFVRFLRLDAKITGVVVGLVAGLGLFVVTNWLVVKGGPMVGPHLSLLGQFFIGYRVTFVGSLIGFAYAFVCGFGFGYLIAFVYNWIVHLREGKKPTPSVGPRQ